MSKSKRFIRTTEDASNAPVGTIILTKEVYGGVRIAAQKHGDNSWFIAYGWEGSTPDKEISGEVLVWGAVQAGRSVTQQNTAFEDEHTQSSEVEAFRDRAEQALRNAVKGYAWDDSLAPEYTDGINHAADILSTLD